MSEENCFLYGQRRKLCAYVRVCEQPRVLRNRRKETKQPVSPKIEIYFRKAQIIKQRSGLVVGTKNEREVFS